MKIIMSLIGSFNIFGSSLAGSMHSPIVSNIKTITDQQTSFEEKEFVSTNESEDDNFIDSEDKGYYEISRLYVDSSKSSEFPDETIKDSVYHKAKKGYIYHNNIWVVQKYNVKSIYGSKEKFLQDHSNLVINFNMGYNLWNSKKGWTFEEGYNLKLREYEKIVPLTGKNNDTRLFYSEDLNHESNEKVWVDIQEFWVNDDLNINLSMQTSLNWAWNSSTNHAALIGTKKEKVAFINNNSHNFEKEEIKIVDYFDCEVKKNDGNCDLSSSSIGRISNHVKNKKNNQKYINGGVEKISANFIGNIYGNGVTGLARIEIKELAFYEVVSEINSNIKYGSNLSVKVYQIFTVKGKSFYSKLYIKIGNHEYYMGKSNKVKWKKGMRIRYTSTYNSSNYYGNW